MTENNEIREEEEPRRPVVVGVDRSENAARAARWAAREALARHAPLTVVNALDLPTDASLPLEPPEFAQKERKAGGEFVESVARDLRAEFPGLEIAAEVSDLAPARTLNTLSSDAALLVTGTRGHGGFSGMLLGSVSRKLAAHAHTPLVVVRGYESEDLIDEVVLGVEDAESSAAIQFAFDAAQRYGSSLHAVRAWSPRPTYAAPAGPFFAEFEEFQADERKGVEQLLAPFHSSYPAVHVQITAARGNPVPVLVETARNTRLIVVGSHRHRGPLAVGAGYVVDGLLAHSPTPVAVVPITSTTAQ